MKRLLPIALFTAFIWSTQIYADDYFSVGQKFEEQIKLNNPDKSVIFLPPGSFEVVGYWAPRNNLNQRIARLVLAKFDKNSGGEKIVKNAVQLLYNIDAEGKGWVEAKLCDRKDYHFVNNIENYNHSQDCYGLNHYRPTLLGSKSKKLTAIGELLVEKGIRQPQKFLFPFYRFADTFSLIQIFYHFNPEGYGFENQERTSWKASPWHPSNIANDARKLKFKDAVLSWSKEHYPVVKAAAWGKAKAKFSLPDLIGTFGNSENKNLKPSNAEVINATKMPPTDKQVEVKQAPIAGENTGVSERLKALKKLEDAGLISKEEAAAKRKEILKNL